MKCLILNIFFLFSVIFNIYAEKFNAYVDYKAVLSNPQISNSGMENLNETKTNGYFSYGLSYDVTEKLSFLFLVETESKASGRINSHANIFYDWALKTDIYIYGLEYRPFNIPIYFKAFKGKLSPKGEAREGFYIDKDRTLDVSGTRGLNVSANNRSSSMYMTAIGWKYYIRENMRVLLEYGFRKYELRQDIPNVGTNSIDFNSNYFCIALLYSFDL